MFSSVSWSQYFITVLVLLAIYYLYIGFKYYGDEINAFLRGKSNRPFVPPSNLPERELSTQTVDSSNALLGRTTSNRAETQSATYKNPVIPISNTAYPPLQDQQDTPVETDIQSTDDLEDSELQYETVEQIELDFEDSELIEDNSIPVQDLTDLVDGIDDTIKRVSDEDAGKVIMTENLRSLLEPHSSFNPGIKEKLNQYVSDTADQTGAPVISKEEVAALWSNTFFD